MAFVNSVALPAPPWTEQSQVYHARALRRLVRLVSRGRSGVVGSADFAVTPTSPASMQVQAAPGDAVALSPGVGLGSYIPYQDSTPLSVTVPASDPTNPTNHLICIQILDSDWQGATMAGSVGVLQGTPAPGVNAGGTGDPTIPTDGVYLPLARVTLPALASSVTAAMITDIRQVVGFGGDVIMTTAGPPTLAGSLGDGVLDSDGVRWVCIAAGVAGSAVWTPTNPYVRKIAGTGASGVINFGSIPQWGSSLEFDILGAAGAAGDVAVTFNGDGATHYSGTQSIWLNGTMNNGSYSGISSISWGPRVSGAASQAGGNRMIVPNYASNGISKQAMIQIAQADSWGAGQSGGFRSGQWSGTAPITSVTFTAGSNFRTSALFVMRVLP